MTDRQRMAAEKAVENGGNISKAMRESGYSTSTAKNPKKLTDSKGWKELLDFYLPNEMLLAYLADDIKYRPNNRRQLLELAFKLKGLFKTELNIETPIPILGGLSNIEEVIKRDKEKYGI